MFTLSLGVQILYSTHRFLSIAPLVSAVFSSSTRRQVCHFYFVPFGARIPHVAHSRCYYFLALILSFLGCRSPLRSFCRCQCVTNQFRRREVQKSFNHNIQHQASDAHPGSIRYMLEIQPRQVKGNWPFALGFTIAFAVRPLVRLITPDFKMLFLFLDAEMMGFPRRMLSPGPWYLLVRSIRSRNTVR